MTPVTNYESQLRERFPEGVTNAIDALDMPTITVTADALVRVLEALRDDFAFTMLTDVSACDWLGRDPRFHVNYHLYSLERNERLRVKVELPDTASPTVPSATPVFVAADWHEREIYDFFGIDFAGHPDLRRILMPDEWIGHPLRKDYPVGGVPVEYKIEPAYVGSNVVSRDARPAAGGMPVRIRSDRGRLSHWTWTGPPASGVPVHKTPEPEEISHEGSDE